MSCLFFAVLRISRQIFSKIHRFDGHGNALRRALTVGSVTLRWLFCSCFQAASPTPRLSTAQSVGLLRTPAEQSCPTWRLQSVNPRAQPSTNRLPTKLVATECRFLKLGGYIVTFERPGFAQFPKQRTQPCAEPGARRRWIVEGGGCLRSRNRDRCRKLSERHQLSDQRRAQHH